MSVGEHVSSSMMGPEGFGSDSLTLGDSLDAAGSSGGRHGTVVRDMPFLHRVPTDRKQMLELGKEVDKLKAMRMIIQDMARGVDQSQLFPSVVKTVICKSVELKKLVYMYLVRYADELPDLALLSISTFQKGLKESNQLIRASALRVLSSIRVPVIVPITLIALKQASTDMSPYVRKTVAHALPKLYQLAPREKESLLEILEQLLHDRTTIVIGSVIMAFEDLCPERLDLIHKHFRKLCNMLIDIDEWGQMSIVRLLTRYGRTQFVDPNSGVDTETEQPFYAEEESETEDAAGAADVDGDKKKKGQLMDPDHRLLLRSCLPLLQSRNSGVVLAVVHLYHRLAPFAEMSLVIKPLIRLLRAGREVQQIALTAINTLAVERKSLFEPYIKNFFVRSNDPRFVRLLKLEILTQIANETNIPIILREFQQYVRDTDKEFVTTTIQCIGRCASKLTNVTESCLTGLMSLVSKKDEAVVAESVVVIKKLLQLNPEGHKDIIIMMSLMANTIVVPMARASILWLIGEYSAYIPKIAPDVLRQMAITFSDEEDIVKLQILNLSAKLFVNNHKQTKLLVNYVLNLAKYDQNYDIRDRARLIRALLLNKESKLHKHCKQLFLSEKPAPNLQSPFTVRSKFEICSLSHALDMETLGYTELPAFPEEAPDPTVRNVEEKAIAAPTKEASFFSDGEESGSSSSESESGSGSGSDSEDSSDTSSDDDDDDDAEDGNGKVEKESKKKHESSSSESSSSDSENFDDHSEIESGTESEESSSGSESSSEAEEDTPTVSKTVDSPTTAAAPAVVAAAAPAPVQEAVKTEAAKTEAAPEVTSAPAPAPAVVPAAADAETADDEPEETSVKVETKEEEPEAEAEAPKAGVVVHGEDDEEEDADA